jgi:hypothetical protein
MPAIVAVRGSRFAFVQPRAGASFCIDKGHIQFIERARTAEAAGRSVPPNPASPQAAQSIAGVRAEDARLLRLDQ